MVAAPHVEQRFGEDIGGFVERSTEIGAALLGALGGLNNRSQRRVCIHGW